MHLYQTIKKKAFIFLDSYNREGKIAQRAAKAYNTEFEVALRPITYYLDNMEAACALLGTHFNFTQLHTYGFHTSCNLVDYKAVFGGFFSDCLIKGVDSPQKSFKIGKHILFNSLYDMEIFIDVLFDQNIFSKSYVENIIERRKDLTDMVKNFRDRSSSEWKNFWPFTNEEVAANFIGNRRLFRSYEPIIHSEIIKILSSIPQSWKINRRLYHKAFKPLLKRVWNVPHGENGYLPYFSNTTNIAVKLIIAFYRRMMKNKYPGNQGPWSDWNEVINTELMNKKLQKYSKYFSHFKGIFDNLNFDELLGKKLLNTKQMLIVLQLIYLRSIESSGIMNSKLLYNL